MRSRMPAISRRDFAALAAAALLSTRAHGETTGGALARSIPSTGERLPTVGLGTARVFDRDGESAQRAASDVIHALIDADGRLIDTASTYGNAETVLGNVIAAGDLREKLFIATKVESPNRAELDRSLRRLKTAKLDLLQLHNVRNPRQSLAQLRAWKDQGLCRYIGITSTFHGDYAAVAAVLEREKPDFVQIGYSIQDREPEKRILPLAAEVKAAVLTAEPLGRGGLFRAVRRKSIPDWASSFATNWAQFFLKYLLADERVTAVIPATSNAAHMAENLTATRGPLPDAEQRRRMVAFMQTL
jgi:aryl-alcohol dehydrogenase-like predicted oxidoreductase